MSMLHRAPAGNNLNSHTAQQLCYRFYVAILARSVVLADGRFWPILLKNPFVEMKAGC